MSEITRENEIALDFAKQSIQLASSTLSSTRNTSGSVAGEFKEINEAAFSWLLDKNSLHNKRFQLSFRVVYQ